MGKRQGTRWTPSKEFLLRGKGETCKPRVGTRRWIECLTCHATQAWRRRGWTKETRHACVYCTRSNLLRTFTELGSPTMPVHLAVEPHIRSRTANVRGTRSGKCGRSGCNRTGERNQVACVQYVAYAAPFDPFKTIVKVCFRDRVSSTNREESP